MMSSFARQLCHFKVRKHIQVYCKCIKHCGQLSLPGRGKQIDVILSNVKTGNNLHFMESECNAALLHAMRKQRRKVTNGYKWSLGMHVESHYKASDESM